MSDKTPKDDMDIEDPEDVDEGYEASGEDGDFVEEDWESFDEEGQYLDDGDGDGGKAARTAAFNRIVIGCAVVGAVVVGYYTMFSGKKEDLGHPQMEEVSQAAPVSANDKVEFHAETKVDANDAFGVQYGEEVDKEQEVKPNLPPAGLLNNPGMLSNIRGQIMEPEVAPPPPSPGMPQEVSGDPPMPSPIWSPAQEPAQAQGQDQAQDVPGLMPMPGEKAAAAEKAASDVPRSPDDGAAADPLAAWRANAVTDKVPASAESGAAAADMDVMDMEMGMDPDMTAQPDRTPPAAQQPEGMSRMAQAVADRQMDKILQRLDSMEKTLSGIQDRLEDIEHDKAASPVKTAARSEKKSSSSSSSSSSTHRKTSSSGTRATTWVLKSAQPGSALLARKGDGSTVSVSVGQTVQGIGRITSIDRQGGLWVVQGTNGSVKQ